MRKHPSPTPAQYELLRLLADGWFITYGYHGTRIHRHEGKRRGEWRSTSQNITVGLRGNDWARWYYSDGIERAMRITAKGRKALAAAPLTPRSAGEGVPHA